MKKKIVSRDIEEGFINLQSIYNIGETITNLDMDLFEDCYKLITGEELPDDDKLLELSFEKKVIYEGIKRNVYLPPRILFGIEGHETEAGLRKCFYKYINKNIGVKGFSVASFPNLIISGENSLMKLDGMPYYKKIKEDYTWVFYGSCNANPLMLLSKIILERLSYKLKIDCTDWLAEHVIENLVKLLGAKPVLKEEPEKEAKVGWAIRFYSIKGNKLKKTITIIED